MEKTAENYIDNSSRSGIIKASERIEIHPDKINKFLLKPGAKHSKEFFDVGYNENDYERLFNDITSEFDNSKVLDIKKNEDGTEDFSHLCISVLIIRKDSELFGEKILQKVNHG